ncbi:hypothetical protein B7486_56715 [cyanobacterium TDX16]|nr:hypothetical protein B7486_56715 [cyanobacterium TDX16]
MSRKPLLDPNRSYTFSNYFDLNADPFDLVGEFGYSLIRNQLQLPQFSGDLEQLNFLKQRIDSILPYVDLTNETARREILIAPIVSELVQITHARLSIEYSLQVTSQLQGTLDYYLRTQTHLLVIEAKQADLTRGFTQLAIEMIALDQWTDLNEPNLLGAITTGNIWQFGVLHRSSKQIEQVLNLYRVTEDIEAVVRILLAALIRDERTTQARN